MNDDQEQSRTLMAALSHSQELLRQAVALFAEVDRQQVVDAQTLATIRQKVLESRQFRAGYQRLFERAAISDEAFDDELD